MPEPVPVCAANDLIAGQIRGASLPDGTRIALYNIKGRIYATDDTCTHEEASLSQDGTVVDDQVECGWHFCAFDIATGEVCSSPCSEPLRTYRVTVVDGMVYVEQ